MQPLIDRIAAKLPAWKAKFLDHFGRLTLVNSMLTSMPVHSLTVFALKKWAIRKIDSIRRSFLWKGAASANGGHCLVRWPKATRPKILGGLGILDPERFRACLVRLVATKFSTFSILNYKTFDFFGSKFDHSSYSKNLCKYSQI